MAKIKTAAGAMAWDSVRETDAMVRNNIDMTRVKTNEISRKKKKLPGCRFRLTMKYRVTLKKIALRILYGISVNMDAIASQDGW